MSQNTFTYDSWGKPAVAVAGGFVDLGFRFRYVGSLGHESDDAFNLGLIYMKARHYDPGTGRFIQRDPLQSAKEVKSRDVV